MTTQQGPWGETICLVHALFPNLSFHIVGPEKMSSDHIDTAFRETEVVLRWKEIDAATLSDLEILRKLIPDVNRLSGQAILVCGYRREKPLINPFVVPIEDLEAFIQSFMESQGKSFFESDAVIIVPDQSALFMMKNRRTITSYYP